MTQNLPGTGRGTIEDGGGAEPPRYGEGDRREAVVEG